jgi:hypothetical protein
MGRSGLRISGAVCCLVGAALVVWSTPSAAITLDKDGDIKLGVETYVNARIGTENTHDGILLTSPDKTVRTSNSATFPHSDAGHLRQNRAFIEVELNHDLGRLVKEGAGPLSLLNDLPFKVKGLGYHFTFRGEGEGLYDWGPNEYSTAVEFNKLAIPGMVTRLGPPVFPEQQVGIDVAGTRRRLRHLGTDRERLYQAYAEANVGNLFMRVGRQILAWGETDGFQLLDHINPLDSSFGGFLISLDERRVPLDMGIANYYLGDFGPLSEMHLEGFAAIDNSVGYYPGTPAGSPWALPSLGNPGNTTRTFALRPARTINNARGGGQLKFNILDATFGIAHYYTRFDTPALQIFTAPCGPRPAPCGVAKHYFDDGYPTHAIQTAPKVQVSGVTTTFALERFYSVVRSEVAYFKDEPAFTQSQLDPFIYQSLDVAANPRDRNANTGGRRLRDSFNAVVGLDMNQWIRALNPNQTFFISTQFFYKHIKDGAKDEALPITFDMRRPPGVTSLQLFAPVEPMEIRQPINQYLQTLFIGTSFRSGTISPGFTFFYDWGGAFLYQPAITVSRDPFRFTMDYSIIDSHIYKGGSGVSLLKDRDNIQFRVEYVI